jgi:hypothetical protein
VGQISTFGSIWDRSGPKLVTGRHGVALLLIALEDTMFGHRAWLVAEHRDSLEGIPRPSRSETDSLSFRAAVSWSSCPGRCLIPRYRQGALVPLVLEKTKQAHCVSAS